MVNIDSIVTELEYTIEAAQEALIYLKRAERLYDSEKFQEAIDALLEARNELERPYELDTLRTDIELAVEEIEEEIEEQEEESEDE